MVNLPVARWSATSLRSLRLEQLDFLADLLGYMLVSETEKRISGAEVFQRSDVALEMYP